VSTFDAWHKKYLAAHGNPYEREAWLKGLHARGYLPQNAAADSRWILPHEFDGFLARVRAAVAAELMTDAPLFAKGVQ
jgi:hypothetical protein